MSIWLIDKVYVVMHIFPVLALTVIILLELKRRHLQLRAELRIVFENIDEIFTGNGC